VKPQIVKVIILSFCLCCLIISLAADPIQPDREIDPRPLLEEAIKLYDGGKYEECRIFLDELILQHEDKLFNNLYKSEIAQIYLLRSQVSYAFRKEGYQDEIHDLLLTAVTIDPDIQLEDPEKIPPFILGVFHEVREAYISGFSRLNKRHNLGLFFSLLIDPTVLSDPLLLQPEIYYSFNMSKGSSLTTGFGIPVTWPPWNSIRGHIGLLWMPVYRVERLSSGLTMEYHFALSDLERFTHSISFGFLERYINRSGLGIGVNIELILLDFIFGISEVPELPGYQPIDILGGSFMRMAFANTRISVFWNF